MLLKLSNCLVLTLLGTAVCSTASIVPRHENDNDVPDSAGNATSTAVCTVSYVLLVVKSKFTSQFIRQVKLTQILAGATISEIIYLLVAQQRALECM